MDWKIFTATFSAIFIAELADKTQLVGIGMSAKSGKMVTVWMGSVAAYMLVTAISVLAGAMFSHIFKPEVIRYFGAGMFVIIGVLMFLGKI